MKHKTYQREKIMIAQVTKLIRQELFFSGTRPQELDDQIQDTWVALLSRRGLDDADNKPAYVRRAARNMRIDTNRRRQQPQGETPEAVERKAKSRQQHSFNRRSILDTLISEQELELALGRAQEVLTQLQWETLLAQLWGDSTTEIAKRRGATRTSVETMLRRTHAQLREEYRA